MKPSHLIHRTAPVLVLVLMLFSTVLSQAQTCPTFQKRNNGSGNCAVDSPPSGKTKSGSFQFTKTGTNYTVSQILLNGTLYQQGSSLLYPGATIWFGNYNGTSGDLCFYGNSGSDNATLAGNYTFYFTDPLSNTNPCSFVVTSGGAASTLTPGSIGSNQTVCAISTPAALTSLTAPTGGATPYTYQWQSSTTSSTSGFTAIASSNTAGYTIPSALSQTTYFMRIVTDNGGASVNSNVVTITVDPASVGGTLGGGNTYCNGTNSTTLTLTGYTGAIQDWESSSNSNFTSPVSLGFATASHLFTNVATTTYYRVKVKSGSCAIAYSAVASITINPSTPSLSSSLTASTCSNTSFTYTPTSSFAGATFTWTRAVVTGISNALGSGSGAATETLINTTTAPVDVTYVYTTTTSCASNNQNVVVTVNPTPTLSSTLSPAAICNGTFSYTPSSATTGATFAWSRAAVTGISQTASNGTGNISETLTNTTSSPVAVTYVITTSANSCSDEVGQNVVVTVNPTPALSSTLSPAAICNGTFSYTPASATTGASFAWSRAAVTGISQTASNGTGSISEILTNTTTSPVNVTYVIATTANSCSDEVGQNVVVTVNPTPALSSTLSPAAICNGTFSYTPASATAGATFAWSRAAVTGISQTASNGTGSFSETLTNTTSSAVAVTYVITTSANGCSDEVGQNVVVTVNPTPVLSSTLSPAAICNGTFSYTPSSATTGATFAWSRAAVTDISQTANSGTGSISETLTNTTTSPVNVTYVITTTANSCSDEVGQQVIVTVNPAATVDAISNQTICVGSSSAEVIFSGTATQFTWTNSNTAIGLAASGSTTVDPFEGTNAGSTQITGTITVTPSYSGCTGTPASFTISVDPVAQGGSLSGGTTVCAGTNSTTLTLAGQAGTITKWQWSNTAAFTTANDIVATGISYTADNLSTARWFRAVISSGTCPVVYSTVAGIAVYEASVGGTITGGGSVCPGTNSSTLTLIENTGTVLGWQSAADAAFTSPVDIENSAASLTVTNLGISQYYRAKVQNGGCSIVYSDNALIDVNGAASGGSISGTTSVCAGSNSATLTVSGQQGNVTKWQSASDVNFTTGVADINQTSLSLTLADLTSTTYYRAMISPGSCASVFSPVATITVDTPASAGTITGATTVCAGSNNTTLTLTGYSGTIRKWKRSVAADFSTGVVDINNTTATLVVSALSETTYYKVMVDRGACSAAATPVVAINVDQPAVGGSLSGSTEVCAGTNTAELILSGSVGSIQGWQSSTDANFSSVNNISSTASSLVVNNLTVTTYYRVVVIQGVCAAAYSSTATVTIDPIPSIMGATALNAGNTVMLGANTTPATNDPWMSATPSIATISSNGVVTGVAVGSTSINFTDAKGCHNSVTLTVNPAAAALVAGPITASGSAETVLQSNIDEGFDNNTGNLNLTTIDLDPATPGVQSSMYTPGVGTLTVTSNGGLLFTPERGFVGTGSFNYTVTDKNGNVSNVSTVTVSITSNLPAGVSVPNGFSPNGDGMNDFFIVEGAMDLKVGIYVYNRWGNLVYQSANYKNDWNGTSSTASALPDGTYFYIVEFESTSNPKRYASYLEIRR